ncbi:MAG: hypothetical protein M1511_10860 [Deltaproteobacteria bacterium]|nr:hypothetical protein [Deltaproteobacteria bacterium]
MTVKRLVLTMLLAFVMSVLLPPIYAQDNKVVGKTSLDKESSQLLGKWEIYETKEPGKPYLESYKGRPFVSKGANAFTLILQYNNDGTFRRTAIIGDSQTVEEGTWRLSGHELRHKRKGASEEEIMYVRFNDKNHYVSTEVFEDTSDPGLFAKFRRIN